MPIKFPVLGSLGGDTQKPASGSEVLKSKERLDATVQMEAPSIPFRLTVEGTMMDFYTLPVLITTNAPVESAMQASLNDKVPVLGFSSYRNERNREDLEGARARVLVADYGEFGRVVVVNCPVPKVDHLAQDALAHTMAVNTATGEVILGEVIADGNTSVEVRENLVPTGVTPITIDKKAHTVLIPAAGSARYADIPARNAFRIPAFLGNLPKLADTFVRSIDRNPDYIGVFGGSTAQMLGAKLNFVEGTMELDFLGLGSGGDFGVLEVGIGSQSKGVMLVGNNQDISYEGIVPGYEPSRLKMSLRGEKYPLSVIQMTSDGIKPLPTRFADGVELSDILYADPKMLVGYLANSSAFGKAHDDESLIIYVPPRPEAVATLVAEEVKKAEVVESGDVVVGGDRVPLISHEGDEVVKFDDQVAAEATPDIEALQTQIISLQEQLLEAKVLISRRLSGETVPLQEIAQALGVEIPQRGQVEESKELREARLYFEALLGKEQFQRFMGLETEELFKQIYIAVKPMYEKLSTLKGMVEDVWKGKRRLLPPDIEELFGFQIDPKLKIRAYKAAHSKGQGVAASAQTPASAPTEEQPEAPTTPVSPSAQASSKRHSRRH